MNTYSSGYDIRPILYEIIKVSPYQEHSDAVSEIERIFREHKFFTTREYPIYSMKDKSGRAGRIDLIARKGKFRVAVEYDHKYNVKYKSFQKIIQIKPEVAIGITGLGYLSSSVKRAERYKTSVPLYVISLREGRYKLITEPRGKQ
jgi:hypothetical protein